MPNGPKSLGGVTKPRRKPPARKGGPKRVGRGASAPQPLGGRGGRRGVPARPGGRLRKGY